ncbi:MAG TPA: FtsX-like permease family protein, partial [Paracoccaceae bacterium]|nr:FtsX-like permease family protein [Paracoccaceae bacterium]
PRSMASVEGLRAAGLLSAGVAHDMHYRLRLPPSADIPALRAEFEHRFPDSGARWRDHRDAAPGTRRFVERLTAFLTIVGIASLAIGGVGIGAGVRDYLARKTPTIAALRALGATGRMVFSAYALQIGLIAAFGILLGLLLGGGVIAWGAPYLARDLPVPAEFGFYPGPLLRAALFGGLVAALFTAWPLARLRQARPAALFRADADPRRPWPGRRVVAIIAALALALAAAVIGLSEASELAAWSLAGLVAAFALLWLCGRAGAFLAGRASHLGLARNRPGLRLALGSIGAPGAGTAETVLALGLGLAVLSAIGQIDANMQRMITRELPVNSPAFFLLDLQPAQLPELEAIVDAVDRTGGLATAPMLRGTITHLDGVPAGEASVDRDAEWILQGDRGVSFAATPPPGTELTAGQWWAEDYSGPPLVSFSAKEAEALGLKIRSTITVSVLGRPITAEIASLRHVEWQGLGINFMMIMDRAALEGAPHTVLATLHANPDAEGPLMRALAHAMPNVTPILVRAQIERVAEGMTEIATGIRWAALAVLLSGLAVLIGTAASGEERRNREAAILKMLGASRAAILGSFALRSALLGLLAASIALGLGTAAAWGVQHFVLGGDYTLPLRPTLAILAAGTALSLAAGLGFSIGPLRRRPAATLRARA